MVTGRKQGEDGNTKTWIPQERKELFRWNTKTFFIAFKGLSFGKNLKFDKKIADTSFKYFL